MAYPIKGSCQCGGVRYTLLQPPRLIAACHCKECQKLSTSAFSITFFVEADAVEFEGEMADWRRKADSGNTNAARFCPTCGNRVYHYDPDKPDMIKLKPIGLEDPSVIQPTAHIWVSEKQPWFTLPEGVDVHDRQP